MKNRPESATSNAKMQEVKVTESPFVQGEKGLEVDQGKLAQLWAATQEALQAVGDGFVTVVDSTNALIEDNAAARKSNDFVREDMRKTRKDVVLGVMTSILIGMFMLGAIYLMVASATRDVKNLVRDQSELLEETRKACDADQSTVTGIPAN